jgi:hypothetical protein
MRTLLAVAGLALTVSACGHAAAEFGGLPMSSAPAGHFPGQQTGTHCYTSQFDPVHPWDRLPAGEHDGHPRHFNGDSVFAWNDKDQRIEYYIWGSDGSRSKLHAYYSGEELVFPVDSKKDPSTVAYRSVWRRIDASSFEYAARCPRRGLENGAHGPLRATTTQGAA